jgi:hypothetical protein
VDRMVFGGDRLVFEGQPILAPPLCQDPRNPRVTAGGVLDSHSACRPLGHAEQARLAQTKAASIMALSAEAEKVREAFLKDHATKIMKRGQSEKQANLTIERWTDGILTPDVTLEFDDPELADKTVGDVLANPEQFIGETLADPLEGISYGRGKAMIMRGPGGHPFVNSFAHGHTVYRLAFDAATVKRQIEASPHELAVNEFAQFAIKSVLSPAEEDDLKAFVSNRANVKISIVGRTLKAARTADHAALVKAQTMARLASSTDRRPQKPVPSQDAERTPVARYVDEVLAESTDPIPPMRDLNGNPVFIDNRTSDLMHGLTPDGSNGGESAAGRLPPPEMVSIVPHDSVSIANEIEHHIEFVTLDGNGESRAVALPRVFLDHVLKNRESQLPRIAAVTSTPLMLPSGELISAHGLNRDLRTMFVIDPKMRKFIPVKPSDNAAVARMLNFLCNDWLCDVVTNFEGKCVLISAALSIIERVVLSDRPVFFATAGKPGSGKTTVLTMLLLAVTGQRPAAAAWSDSAEERAKAILAMFMQGVSHVIWDNIPTGTLVSCPTIEKASSASIYTGRVLGKSLNVTAPATSIMMFTGNNISPVGDTANRALIVRLAATGPEPENREYQHSDSTAWTLDHRGQILHALYTLLLSNPQITAAGYRPPRTRFKTWWHLIGSAVEHAAQCLCDEEGGTGTAAPLDFRDLFRAAKADDIETNQARDVLRFMWDRWLLQTFKAADVFQVINEPGALDDRDEAETLRAFFTPTTGKMSVNSIGLKLGSMIGSPEAIGGCVIELAKVPRPGKHKGADHYRLEAR